MNKLRILPFLLWLFVIVSCEDSKKSGSYSDTGQSELLSLTISVENLHEIVLKMRDDQSISPLQLDYFHSGLMGIEDTIYGKTVAAIIDSGIVYVKQNRAAEAYNLANAYIMKEMINVSIMDFKTIEENKNYRIFVNFKNKSDRTIRTNSGTMRIRNPKGDVMMIPVNKIPLNLIPGNETTNYFEIKDSLLPTFIRLTNGNEKNVRTIEWLNTEVEFQDGDRIIVRH